MKSNKFKSFLPDNLFITDEVCHYKFLSKNKTFFASFSKKGF